MSNASWSAIVLNPADDVAVALKPLGPGPVSIRMATGNITIDVIERIELGHKLALHGIEAGGDVRKYGEIIGCATAFIPKGGHVHEIGRAHV